ncbi:hypothetical protein ACLIJJ_16655 [Niallia sp. BSM11]
MVLAKGLLEDIDTPTAKQWDSKVLLRSHFLICCSAKLPYDQESLALAVRPVSDKYEKSQPLNT